MLNVFSCSSTALSLEIIKWGILDQKNNIYCSLVNFFKYCH